MMTKMEMMMMVKTVMQNVNEWETKLPIFQPCAERGIPLSSEVIGNHDEDDDDDGDGDGDGDDGDDDGNDDDDDEGEESSVECR